MKTKRRKHLLTFGDLVAAAYRAWGSDRAKGLVRLVVNAHIVVFQGRQRFMMPDEPDENVSLKIETN